MARPLCKVCLEKPATRGGGRCNACYTKAMNEAGATPAGKLEMRRVDWLKPHPLNQGIYRDGADAAFVASIRANGVLTPIIATPDGIMASGHRRREAARLAGLDEVPVIIREFADEDALLLCLIASNAQRRKTPEQYGREAGIVETVHGRRANGEGHWYDLAGDLLAVSGETARKACATVKAMDEAEALGNKERAQRIREALGQSVHRGYEEARGRTAPPAGPTPQEIDGQGYPRVEAAPTPWQRAHAEATGEEEEQNPPEPAPEREPRQARPETEDDEGMPLACPQGCPLATREERIPFFMAGELFPPMEAVAKEAIKLVGATLAREAPGLERLKAYAERRVGRKPEGHPPGVPAPMVHYLAETDNALRKIRAHRPACRWCPSCALRGKGNHRECARCQGLPYVTQAVWDEATDEGRRAALARGAAGKGAA